MAVVLPVMIMLRAAAARANVRLPQPRVPGARRIATGLSLLEHTGGGLRFVHAHPWHTETSQSNAFVDNSVSAEVLFRGRRVAMFSLPLIWGPVCMTKHMPAYIALADEILLEVDELCVFCSGESPYAANAWRTLLGDYTSMPHS